MKLSNIKNLHIDIETYSDIDIKKGVYKYIDTPSFEILLIAYKIDNGDINIIDLKNKEKVPSWFKKALSDKKIIKHAFNAQFERICLAKYLNIDLRIDPNNVDWHCTMVHASTLGLPQSLKKCSEYLRIEEEKDTAGIYLISYFSKPNTKRSTSKYRNLPKDNPKKWDDFREYCKQDVRVEYILSQKLNLLPMPQSEIYYYGIDQLINDRGVKVDKGLVEVCVELMNTLNCEYMRDLYEVTKLENPNSIIQLRSWLKYKGVFLDSLDRQAILKYLKNKNIRQDVKKALELRLFMSNSSLKKYKMIQDILGSDGRIRGLLQFVGASKTGRWAGRLLQVQNLPKSKISDLDNARFLVKNNDRKSLQQKYKNIPNILKQLIRTTLIAKKDCLLYICDYSSIEARILAWYANESWVLDVFKSHGKIYEATAAKMFGLSIEKIDSALRQKGKVANLALGYQGSLGALKAMGALEMGLTEGELISLVRDWRRSNPNITQFWRDVDRCAKTAIFEKTNVKLRNLLFRYSKGFLFITLPSGRCLSYPRATLEPGDSGNVITYETKGLGVNFQRVQTYGGKLVENIVQATARDILAHALKTLHILDIDVVFHVHDEIVCEIPRAKHKSFERLVYMAMVSGTKWSEGLPLAAEGYSSEYYKK